MQFGQPTGPSFKVERVEEACKALPDDLMRQTLQVSRHLYKEGDLDNKDHIALVKAVGKEILAVGTKGVLITLTYPTLEAWSVELRLRTLTDTERPNLEKLQERIMLTIRDDPHKFIESLTDATLKRVSEDVGINTEQPTPTLKQALKDEIVILGWEGFLQAQVPPVLKQLHHLWRLNVPALEAQKQELIERLVSYIFGLPFSEKGKGGDLVTSKNKTSSPSFSRLPSPQVSSTSSTSTSSPSLSTTSPRTPKPQVSGTKVIELQPEKASTSPSSTSSTSLMIGTNNGHGSAGKNLDETDNLSESESSRSESEDGEGRKRKRRTTRGGSADEVRVGMTEHELVRLRSVDLKAYCKAQNLPSSGTKQILATQILTFWQAGGASAAFPRTPLPEPERKRRRRTTAGVSGEQGSQDASASESESEYSSASENEGGEKTGDGVRRTPRRVAKRSRRATNIIPNSVALSGIPTPTPVPATAPTPTTSTSTLNPVPASASAAVRVSSLASVGGGVTPVRYTSSRRMGGQ
jgi:hypothetical protein